MKTTNRPFIVRIPTAEEAKNTQHRKAIKDKRRHLQNAIKEAKDVLLAGNAEAILAMVKKIISVYETECPEMRGGYNSESFLTKDFSNYLEILIARLEKLSFDIAVNQNTHSNIQINNSPTFSNSVVVNITISCVHEAIEASTLSDDEKDIIKGKLADIEVAVQGKKDKKTVWEKIKDALGWIASKTVDVGLAVTLVPYLSQILQGLGL